ncbi:MAG: glycosyltransferase family 2 protein [Candidatus Pacearchaeota archaeon]
MNPIYNALVYITWFASTYFVVLLLLAMYTKKDRLYEKKRILKRIPKVSIVVPAFNEEKKIVHTIKSLKKIDYKNIEFIIVNDGSTDSTSKVVRKTIRNDKRFTFIDRQINKGKAASLNEGIKRSQGKFVACMDADSVVEPRIFYKALPYFDQKDVGAVTISVGVKKPKNFLHKVIEIEYIIGLSLFLKIFSFFGSIFVTPGPFSIYRKSVLDKIKGFDCKSIVEDYEIAFRIHKAGYRIENCLNGKVHTIVPPTFKEIYAQRKRWYSGAIYTMFKHHDITFNKKLGTFGYFAPFNFFLIFLGMALFYASTFLATSRLFKGLKYYFYTGFNFFEHLLKFEIDLLATQQLTLIGVFAFILTVIVMLIGLKITKNDIKKKKVGILGFPFMFFLYQIFWTGAIFSVIFKRNIKWR